MDFSFPHLERIENGMNPKDLPVEIQKKIKGFNLQYAKFQKNESETLGRSLEKISNDIEALILKVKDGSYKSPEEIKQEAENEAARKKQEIENEAARKKQEEEDAIRLQEEENARRKQEEEAEEQRKKKKQSAFGTLFGDM